LLPAISERAAQLIVGCEVTSEAVCTARYLHPERPQGASGVTIGIGYDIGYVSPDELSADWSGQLATKDIETLSRACGVTGSPARALTSELQDVDVPWAAANAVFRSHTIPHTIAQTIEALPRAAQLPPDCLGALVSLVYNRGAAFNMTDAPGNCDLCSGYGQTTPTWQGLSRAGSRKPCSSKMRCGE
jgi:hypothetical protein